jgi:hypothetical protein
VFVGSTAGSVLISELHPSRRQNPS